MQPYMIAKAKRIADLYGEWVKNNVPNREKKLNELLNNEPNPKIRKKSRYLINHRHDE